MSVTNDNIFDSLKIAVISGSEYLSATLCLGEIFYNFEAENYT